MNQNNQNIIIKIMFLNTDMQKSYLLFVFVVLLVHQDENPVFVFVVLLVHQDEKPLFVFVFDVILVFWEVGEWSEGGCWNGGE